MAGYVIHIAIGNAILDNNKGLIKDYKSYLQGLIGPDYEKHRLMGKGVPKRVAWTLMHKMDMNRDFSQLTDYEKGYFIHLLTDEYFYKKYNNYNSVGALYEDYNKTNRDIMAKYNVNLPNEIVSDVEFVDGEPKILKLDGLVDFIEYVASLDMASEFEKHRQSEMSLNA